MLNHDFATFSSTRSGGGPNKALIEALQSYGTVPLPNYFFINSQDCSFRNASEAAGINEMAISNGAAYADFDNDGDLDLVVNNINSKAFLFSNNTIQPESTLNYLAFKLQGPANNRDGIGTIIKVFIKDSTLLLEQNPVRGYLSTVDKRLFTGLRNSSVADSIQILWPNDRCRY